MGNIINFDKFKNKNLKPIDPYEVLSLCIRSLETSRDLLFKNLRTLLNHKIYKNLKDKENDLDIFYEEILSDLDISLYEREIGWIEKAERAGKKDSKAKKWYDAQPSIVDSIYKNENSSFHTVDEIFKGLAKLDSIIDRGRFILKYLEYNKLKKKIKEAKKVEESA